jgi:tetratricopeptide (TPR) repeat protein
MWPGKWSILEWLLFASLACPIVSAEQPPPQQAAPTPDQRIETARHGMQLLMDGEFDEAIQVFHQLEQTDPESPLGYALEADANWWKIYLTEGNLIDPDVFEALSEAATPYDADFQRLNNLAIQKAEAQIHGHQDEARAHLYEGFVYALQARLEALRDQALATARAAKKMRNLSLTALKLDPTLYDADLGVGIYNYFEATLPGYVKMLRFLILLPGGNRELGLQQLQTAADKGEITKGEAQFHLAKNFSRNNERQYAKSLEIFQTMTREYPDNPLWKLLLGGLEIRMGQTQEGEALYREVVKATENPKAEVWKPLHQQAQKALDRRSGH